MLVRTIIVTAVGESRGSRFYCLRTTCDRLGCLYEEVGTRCDVLRCRSITEVCASSDLEKRAETSGFYGADFFSDLRTSTEPVVLARVRDVISASFQSA